MTSSDAGRAVMLGEADVINSASPIERELLGVHPRMYLDAAGFERLRGAGRDALVGRAVDSLIEVADRRMAEAWPPQDGTGDYRGAGSDLAALALGYRVTGEGRYLDAAVAGMRSFGAWTDWGIDLQFGHTGHGYSVALDWLWHDLDEGAREEFVEAPHRAASVLFDHWRDCISGPVYGYLCNHHTVALAGLTGAASVLYGEREAISPWWNLVLEKLRCTMAACSADGVSPETVAYGSYFSHYLMRTLLLTRALLGVDLLRDSEWFKAYPTGLIHHTLPRKYWTDRSTFMMFGDSDGWHWYGPDAVAWVCAAEYGDRRAQWLANTLDEYGANATPIERTMSLGSIDADVAPLAPEAEPALETFKHFEDLGVVMGRSSWTDDDASVWGVVCGPSMGAKAMREFRNPVAGGHMQAFAGTFQIFSHGQFVICPAGYTQKWTRYHNTVLVDGAGQLGESPAWFEDLPFRAGHACPRMLRADRGAGYDVVVGDAGAAYPDELGVRVYLRHLVYVQPDTWLIVDVLETEAAARFSQLFHTGFGLEASEDLPEVFSGRGESASLVIRSLAPEGVVMRTERQTLNYTDGKPTHELDLLTIENSAAARSAVFVTLLVAGNAARVPSAAEAVAEYEDGRLQVTTPTHAFEFDLAGGVDVTG